MLLGGGGVDGAIHRAAGPELLRACREVKKTLPGGLLATGGAVITPGFLLAAEWVIHCVGPVYSFDRSAAPGLLARCYQGALAICKERGLASVAFPAISTGVFGYPMDEAALVSLCAIRNHLAYGGGPSLVKVVLFDARAYAAFVEVGDTKL